MLAGFFLILLVVAGLVVMALLLTPSPSVLKYYYANLYNDSIQKGSFTTDNVVTITTIGAINPDPGAIIPEVGSFNMVETYTRFSNTANSVLYQCVGTISMNNEVEFTFQNEMYTSTDLTDGVFMRIPFADIKYSNSLITGASSSKAKYIGKKFDVSTANAPGNMYQMRIGL